MNELQRLAGAVLCVGIPAAPDSAALETLGRLAPGGIILFDRNVTSAAQTRAGLEVVIAACGGTLPPLLAVDQEGGRVARLRDGAVALPSMMALGACDDASLAERAGRALAADVRSFGANVDFAPVLDLALDPRCNAVGTRAFGDDPQRVAALGSALIRGLRAGGVAATAKHFPGHGNTPLDSHRELPVVATDAATLRSRELVPFAEAFAAGVDCVMSAHVVVPALEAGVPATLSSRALTGLLREELGFSGVCFTDCLEMDAIASTFGTARAAALAIAAGADCALISHRLPLALAARDAIVEAVRQRELPLARLEEAVARVTRLRASVVGAAAAPFAGGEALARQIAAGAITCARGRAVLDTAAAATVISFEPATREPVSLSSALRRRRVRSELLRAPLEPDAEMREQLTALLAAQPGRQLVVVTRRAHLFPLQQAAAEALLALSPDAILVCALEPFDAAALARARNVLCSYGDDEAAVEALADVLAGRVPAAGRLPVRAACVA
ncbi:MAG: beta-N-acetylhexosaminidase [Vulcanimicrobiaceae bacterium]